MAFPFIKIFTVPVFLENSIEARRANILVSLLRFVVLVLCISVVATIVLFAKKWESFIVIGCMAVPAVLSFILLRMRRVYPASLVLLSGIWVVLTALIYFAGGMQSIDAIYYAALVVMAGLLLGVR
ncbi:MAG TPA: hypothetical protein PK253_15100, partial [Spirochaetota bacterium]|nr:hypothetical protein [Spirochaetota bacterium]